MLVLASSFSEDLSLNKTTWSGLEGFPNMPSASPGNLMKQNVPANQNHTQYFANILIENSKVICEAHAKSKYYATERKISNGN